MARCNSYRSPRQRRVVGRGVVAYPGAAPAAVASSRSSAPVMEGSRLVDYWVRAAEAKSATVNGSSVRSSAT